MWWVEAMWFGILTPGAHPSRPTATREATVLCWTPQDRRKIDGPFAVVHGGLRVLRRIFYDQGLASCAPRCFVCLRACPVPDADDLRAGQDVAEAPAFASAVSPAPPPARAALAFVHLADLDGPADPPLDEEALVVVPGAPLAVLTALDRVADTLALLERAAPGEPPPSCSRCGTMLPGSDAQRRAWEARRSRRRPQRGHGRRAA